jgi:hypothetical protein
MQAFWPTAVSGPRLGDGALVNSLSGEVVTRQSAQEARCSLGQFLPIKSVTYALACDWIGIDDNELVGMNPVLRSAPPALVILDHTLVRRFEIDDVIPEAKHAPENRIIQESELSRPINVVNQLLGGDQEKVLLEKVRSSIPAALRQLPPRRFNTLHLLQYCGSPGMQALNGNKFLVVFVHAPAAPKSALVQRRKGIGGSWKTA